ncbi:KAP family P-loop NTPase fold protein [Dawidia soli]|uniref:KAP family NTPase n=1 Tax=Dawidia soli TaxID=2782352 RepID=A0AAP2DF77_9BACT|nr:P-loop NTPase fold protein [Dawidia soli]MBT1690654.1 KAP family NTPase [Dawidia soli]
MSTIRKPLHTDSVSHADNDALQRLKFATEIADNILHHIAHSNESIVLGIHGPWGSGKSNLLHFIKDRIRKDALFVERVEPVPKKKTRWGRKKDAQPPVQPKKKFYVLEFNPWIFSGKEQLHLAFLNEFALKVQSSAQEIRNYIDKNVQKYRWVQEMGLAGKVLAGFSQMFSETSVDNLKIETNKVLLAEDTHVVVILDDIDRLTPSEMLEVFQLIKLNANFANTVFVISFDKKIVSQAIKNILEFDGDDYLEKIIQVDYSLPAIPDETLEELFISMLGETLGPDSDFETGSLNIAWLMHGLRYYFRNMRDLKRYFNSLAFRLPAIREHIDLHDFILIEAIRLFDFASYEMIRDHYKESLQFAERRYHADALYELPDGTRELYAYLFTNGRNIGLSAGRKFPIHDPEFFDRYFTFSVSKQDVHEKQFQDFTLHPPARSGMVKTLVRDGKIDFLLGRIVSKGKDMKVVDVSDALTSLIRVWSDFRDEFPQHWRTVWDAVKALLTTIPDQNAAYKMLFDEIMISTSELSPARFVFHYVLLENIYQDDEKNIDPQLGPVKELLMENKKRLEVKFLQQLESTYSQFFFHNTHHPLYSRIFFPSLARLNPTKYTEQLSNLLSNNDETSFIDFLKLAIFVDPKEKTISGIDRVFLKKTIIQELEPRFEEKLMKLNPNVLSEGDGMIVKYMQQHY